MANELTDITNKIIKAVTDDQNIRVALSSVLAIHKPRIFEQGLMDRGSKIGTYSKKKIYIPFDKMARRVGSPRTIVTHKQFNAPGVRETKGVTFKGGYDEYKTAIGKNPGYVNLRNTDQMSADYGLIGGSGNYGFGFKNDFNYKKSQWLEDKYNKDIFSLSDIEAKTLENVLYAQLEKIL